MIQQSYYLDIYLWYMKWNEYLISWRPITLQYCSGFCHTLTWISHGVTCIPHPDPPSPLSLHPIPLSLPSAPGPSTCLMLLGIHTEETRSERDTCTPMFITALFTIARTWKQPKCPSADEWIRKLCYIHTMEYYSVIIIISFTMLCNKSVCSTRYTIHYFHVALCTGRWNV